MGARTLRSGKMSLMDPKETTRQATGTPLVLPHLLALFEYAVQTHGDAWALGTLQDGPWRWTTYKELGRQVDACRSALATLGVGRGDRVGIISNNRMEWVVSAHATYQRRAVFVPMYEAQSETEWNHILRDAGVKVCFAANAAIARRVDALRENLVDLQHLFTLDGSAEEPHTFASLLAAGGQREIKARVPQGGDIATIIYTSGTTGLPKGVRLTHSNLAYQACALLQMRDFGHRPRSMAFLPWAHVFGGGVELNVAMLAGTAVAICRNSDDLFSELPNVRPTMLYGVPRIWNHFYDQIQRELGAQSDLGRKMFDNAVQARYRRSSGAPLSLSERMTASVAERTVVNKLKARIGGRLRLAFSGAAPLAREVAEFMHSIGVTIYEGYGLTESSGSSTTNPTGAPKFGSVGKPLPGTTIVIDHDSVEADDPREGEIVVYGPGVMAGYHNLPAETEKVLTPDGGLRTGDVGYLDEEGYLHITGRVKELYKLNSGRYVAPVPLEQKIRLSPFVHQCVVYGDGRPYNVALIVLDMPYLRAYLGGDPRSDDELIADPRTRELMEEEVMRYSRDFRTFELIRKFWLTSEQFTCENRMLTATFKLRRRQVLKVYEGRLQSLY